MSTATVPLKKAPTPVDLTPLDALYQLCAPPIPQGPRYFAIVLKVDESIPVGNALVASTHVGNYVREMLRPGVKAIRSIEITKDTAYNGIR